MDQSLEGLDRWDITQGLLRDVLIVRSKVETTGL